MYNSSLSKTSFYGKVNSAKNAGGLVSLVEENSTIQKSLAIAKINSGEHRIAGGLIANLLNSNVSNCFAQADLIASGNSYGGGIAGELSNSLISDSYYAGQINTQSANFAAIIENSTIENSFFDLSENPGIDSYNSGVQYLNTTEMETQTTFSDSGWDFTNTWTMKTYPYIQGLEKYITISFNLDDGNFISGDLNQEIIIGDSPIAPSFSPPDYMIFTGWDTDLDYLFENTIINALYEESNLVTVTFELGQYGTSTDPLIQSIIRGENATPPDVTPKEGYSFDGWDLAFNDVTSNITVNAVYSPINYTVSFNLNGGTHTGGGNLNQLVFHGDAAETPIFEIPQGYAFRGWSESFDVVKQDLTVIAEFSLIVGAKFTINFDLAEHGRAKEKSLVQSLSLGIYQKNLK